MRFALAIYSIMLIVAGLFSSVHQLLVSLAELLSTRRPVPIVEYRLCERAQRVWRTGLAAERCASFRCTRLHALHLLANLYSCFAASAF